MRLAAALFVGLAATAMATPTELKRQNYNSNGISCSTAASDPGYITTCGTTDNGVYCVCVPRDLSFVTRNWWQCTDQRDSMKQTYSTEDGGAGVSDHIPKRC